MFSKILIANRGEIACRVMRTARRMGIRSVAVYSEADAGALHVTMADEAYHIGGAPAAESYLCIEAVLDAAKRSGAEAIHPGYGFLSENEDFAEACQKAGVVFIGPPASAIAAMGSKSAAKAIMEKARVPLVPGYHGEDQTPALLEGEAGRIGYPVLLKASAGGGGKGMRVVEKPEDFTAALESAKREAQSAFGDSSMLIEKYLARPRHVEIQVFADGQGNAVHLFERDCSIQRRHQKVVEEAPAPGLSLETRRRMGEAAVAAAKAIGYVGAGTVEFLLDTDGAFYFMEMNTRLQVEHPVTEMITGQDLVEWQFKVAAGGRLPLMQDDLAVNGHAIEVRVYAEDPDKNFLPATGRLRHFLTPATGPHVRVETGVRQGDEISIHYDPMIAKLVVWDVDRPAAVRRLRWALSHFNVVGVVTNLEFLGAVAGHGAFMGADLDTRFIERHRHDLFARRAEGEDRVLALACLDVLLRRAAEARLAATKSFDPHSPWHSTSGWRLNDDNHHALTFVDGERRISVMVHFRPEGYVMDLPGGTVKARGEIDRNGDLLADLDGVRMKVTVVRHGDDLTILGHGLHRRLTLFDPAARAAEAEGGSGRLTAPMPGKIVAVMVKAGDKVEKGAPLLVMEAMKMEHTIAAPAAGTVKTVHFRVGDQASDGDELLSLETE